MRKLKLIQKKIDEQTNINNKIDISNKPVREIIPDIKLLNFPPTKRILRNNFADLIGVYDLLKSSDKTVNEFRETLYNNLSPSYYGYENPSGLAERLNNVMLGNDSKIDTYRDDIFAEYLNIPKNKRHQDPNAAKVENSRYRPSVGAQHQNYKRIKINEQDINQKQAFDRFVQHAQTIPYGTSTQGDGLYPYFNKFGASRGFDKTGEYVSYHDLWDLDPINIGRDVSFGIGTPINFYDRIYLDDYYDIPKEYRGNPYIAPAVVTTYRKQGGIIKRVESGKSGIHIKPENRGKFTALKKRTGKSSTWYKEHGTPAQKKMAVFALNAKKWKHK